MRQSEAERLSTDLFHDAHCNIVTVHRLDVLHGRCTVAYSEWGQSEALKSISGKNIDSPLEKIEKNAMKHRINCVS